MTIENVMAEPAVKPPFYLREARSPRDTNFVNMVHGTLGDIYMDCARYDPAEPLVLPVHSRIVMLPAFLKNFIETSDANILLYEKQFGKIVKEEVTAVPIERGRTQIVVAGTAGKGEYANFADILHKQGEFLVRYGQSAPIAPQTIYHTTLRFSPGDFKETVMKANVHLQKVADYFASLK